MNRKRAEVEEAAEHADKIADGLSSFPIKLFVPKSWRTWARGIANILRDVVPLVPRD